MERELKFRAWNVNAGAYLKKYKGDESIGIFTFDVFNSILQNRAYRKEELVAEQYLGRKDKNGKDICDGDIMKVRLGTQSGGKKTRYKYFHMRVFWNHHTAGFELEYPENYGNYRYADGNWGAHEVVGNIRENPELLQKMPDEEAITIKNE